MSRLFCELLGQFLKNSFHRNTLLTKFWQRSVGDDLSFVNHDYSLAKCLDFLHDVGRKEHRFFTPHGPNHLSNLDQLVGVEAGGWLVQDQHVGIVDKRLGQSYALAVPFRELPDFFALFRAKSHPVNHFSEAVCSGWAFQAMQFSYKFQKFPHIHVQVQGVVLGQIADVPLDGLGRSLDRKPSHEGAAGGGWQIARQHFHGSGFASAVGPQKAHDLAGGYRKTDVVDGLLGSVHFTELCDDYGHKGRKYLEIFVRETEQIAF
jgi:hypothetical protein